MRPLPLILTLVLLVACAQPEEDAVALDEEAAQALAHGAQRLGFALDDGDACGAIAEADAVRSQARDGVRSGTVPTDVANEVDAVASEVTADLTCEPDEDDTDGEDAGAEDDRPGEPAPEPEPDDEKRKDDKDDKDDEEEDGPRGGGPDGDGPPGQANGPDDDGPPGQADGGDRGSNRGGGR